MGNYQLFLGVKRAIPASLLLDIDGFVRDTRLLPRIAIRYGAERVSRTTALWRHGFGLAFVQSAPIGNLVAQSHVRVPLVGTAKMSE